MVELGYVASASHEAIRQTLKNELKPHWKNKEWCIPAKENAAFVCAMEDKLGVYKRAYDETHPLNLHGRKQLKQHIRDSRQPVPLKLG